MPKPNKENIITELLVYLENGTNYGTCLELSGTKWNLSKSTFVRYWKIASERYQQTQSKAQKAIAEQSIAATIDRQNEAIISKKKRMEILSQIANGEIPLTKPMVVDGKIELVPVVPDWMDRKNAISELNKMDGSYAPIKQANTDSEGKDIKPSETITDDKFTKLLEKINGISTDK